MSPPLVPPLLHWRSCLQSRGLRTPVVGSLPSEMYLRVIFFLALLEVVFSSHEHRWSEAAWRWLINDCPHCVGHKSQARLYIAHPSKLGRLRAVSADGGCRQSGPHDSILVIDPHPHQRFGHPIFMFFIDLNSSRPQCEAKYGILLEGGDCLTQWQRPRCHRRMPSRRGGCTLLFPPEVRAKDSDTDLLVCSDLWKPCPATRKLGGLSSCNPLATNNKGCDQSLGNPCVFMRTCHHAVVLSGGWNKQLVDQESFSTLRVLNRMLSRNGFASPNIKMFYGNGLNQIEKDLYSEELSNVYPSGIKFALRYHLRSLCEVRQCSNTLFIYLNSPARPDGASLLWDVSGNGELDETEVYTVKEMMRDLGNCKARRIVMVADQAFSSEIIKGLEKYSDNFKNTILFSPEPDDNRNSLVSMFSTLASWQCLSNLGPTWVGSGISNITLSGSPCDINMTEEPSACQNLSTLEMLEADRVILK